MTNTMVIREIAGSAGRRFYAAVIDQDGNEVEILCSGLDRAGCRAEIRARQKADAATATEED